MSRLRYNNAVGVLGASLTPTGTTITFQAAPAFATITGADYIPIVLEPPIGTSPSANFEITYLTAYTAGHTTGTLLRGQEGTTGVAHSSGTVWACTPVTNDFSQVQTSGGTPTIAAGPTSGANPSVAITGIDSAGQVQIVPDAGAGIGDLATITFGTAFPNNVSVIITPAGPDAALVDTLTDNISNTGFSIAAASIPEVGLAGLNLLFNYLVLGHP